MSELPKNANTAWHPELPDLSLGPGSRRVYKLIMVAVDQQSMPNQLLNADTGDSALNERMSATCVWQAKLCRRPC
jgi:hypothetical protein